MARISLNLVAAALLAVSGTPALGQELGDKTYTQKIGRRKNFRRRTGHRQVFTRVRNDAITA